MIYAKIDKEVFNQPKKYKGEIMSDTTVFYLLAWASGVSAGIAYHFPEAGTLFVGLSVWSGIMALKVPGVPFKD